jgi:tetratricopeptide (TPR) repeat protein
MKNLALIFSFLIAINTIAISQEKYNVTSIDIKTYDQYLRKEWKALIKTSKDACENGIDFYYLQVRTGIAYYELKKYAQAVSYFEKANNQNPNDELIQEYLYFSYVFAGRYDDARYFKTSMSTVLKERLMIETKNPIIRAIYIDTKHDINEEYAYVPLVNEMVSQKSVLNQSYYNLSLEHWLGNRVTLFHGYSNLGISNEVLNSNINMPPIFKEFVIQHEYYVSMKAFISKGYSLTGGFHYLNTSYSAPDPTVINTRFGRWSATSGSVLYAYSENSYSGSLSLNKQFSIFNLSAGTSISNLNHSLQFQPGISVRLYPLGSQLLFINTKFDYQIEKNDSALNYYPILKPGFGFSFLKYSWFESSVLFGNLHNYTEFNSFIANNDIDHVLKRYEVLLNIGMAKGKFNLFIKYQYNIKNNSFEINGIDSDIDYSSQTIAGGLKWYF